MFYCFLILTEHSLLSQAKLAIERLSFERAYHPFLCGPRNSVINELTKVSCLQV